MNRRIISQRIFPQILAAIFVLTTGSIAGAQDYDELFAQTDDENFAFFDQVGDAEQNTVPDPDEAAADSRSEVESLPAPAQASNRNTVGSGPTGNGAVQSPSDLRLTDHSGSQAARKSMAMQIRQARALAEMRSRDARLEAERWGLLPNLRPTWSSNLMMSNRYPSHITYIVPVYVWGR